MNRDTWRHEQSVCWICGWPERCNTPMNVLQVHEMARGPARAKAVLEPAAWFSACRSCHEGALAAMPIARQLAYKKMNDYPRYDRVIVNRLRGRADEAVTEDDVNVELIWIVLDSIREGVPLHEIEAYLDWMENEQ